MYVDEHLFLTDVFDRHTLSLITICFGFRCVTIDLGYLGCHTDVLNIADRHCSGRQTCMIRVPDPDMENTRPCLKELKTYLEANYVCLPSTYMFLHCTGSGNCVLLLSWPNLSSNSLQGFQLYFNPHTGHSVNFLILQCISIIGEGVILTSKEIFYQDRITNKKGYHRLKSLNYKISNLNRYPDIIILHNSICSVNTIHIA